MNKAKRSWAIMLAGLFVAMIMLVSAGCKEEEAPPPTEHPTTSEHPTKEHPTKEHPTKEHPTKEHPSKEHPTKEHPS